MRINTAFILCAGFGKRLNPLTLDTPKPLIKLNNIAVLETCINLIESLGIQQIIINTFYLKDQIHDFINNKKFKSKISIIEDGESILDTGGGILNATRSFKDPFVVINPDTLWSASYSNELKDLENLYFKQKKPSLLVVNKNLSFDISFKGDFNLKDGKISRDIENHFIFTGLQILDPDTFSSMKDKIFSMNIIWNYLIKNNSLIGIESKQKFYHINTKEMYDKILNSSIID